MGPAGALLGVHAAGARCWGALQERLAALLFWIYGLGGALRLAHQGLFRV